jgi:glycosyltransferase involved in cell wall biosynthesis
MRSLPMARIHAELERAAAVHPQEPTLRDFRADSALLRAETEGLAAAQRWIGAHAQVVALGGARADLLPWRLPSPEGDARMPSTSMPSTGTPSTRAPGPLRVLFPASSLVRKGVLELSAALRGIDAEVLLPLREGGEAARWGDTPLRRIAIDTPAQLAQALMQCDAVVLPAWVEHQPRALLAAIAQGVPVIATAACGLGALPGWQEVPAGDAEALRARLQRIAERSPSH